MSGIEEIEILGIVAACLTNISFVPQIVKTVRTKQVNGISLLFMIMMGIGCFLWVVYGSVIRAIAVVLSGSVACGLSLTMVALILKYRVSTTVKKISPDR